MPNPEALLFTALADASAAVATNGSNASKVTVTFKDSNGHAVPYAMTDLWLSDDAHGAGVTATTASGTVANDGTTGTDFATLTSKKALRVQANAAGKYALSVTDTAKTAFKVFVLVQGRPKLVATLATASYG